MASSDKNDTHPVQGDLHPEKPLENYDSQGKKIQDKQKKSLFGFFKPRKNARDTDGSNEEELSTADSDTNAYKGKRTITGQRSSESVIPRKEVIINPYEGLSKDVTVQIHNDPFLVKNTSQAPLAKEIQSQSQIPTQSSDTKIEEKLPQRPQPTPSMGSVEKKKSVNIQVPSEKPQQTKIAHKKIATSSPRNTNNNNPEVPVDARTIKRRYAKLKEKEKNRELLSLVQALSENCEYYKNALKSKEDRQEVETYQLRTENESLNLQIFKLGQEIEAWSERCQVMENRSTALSKAKSLTKENKNLLDDIEVLKSVIVRLNRELTFYQDKMKIRFKDSPENIAMYSTETDEEGDIKQSGSNSNWLQNPRKALLPLLIAYDEVIEEKEAIIKDHEVALDQFKTKCTDIIKENAELHKLISDNKDRSSISIDEWESLRLNAVLVLEENDILHEQVNNLKKKEEKLFSTFQEKATGFKQTITHLEGELKRQESAITDLESRCKRLSEENTTLNVNLQAKIPRETHEAMIQEFKMGFGQLKTNFESEKKMLNEKISSFEKEKVRLFEQVSKLEDDNTRLQEHIRDYEERISESDLELQQMKSAILEQSSTREATGNVIEDLMKHVQQLATEKNKLAGDLNEQKLLNEKIMALRGTENELVIELHGKIEAMERLHNDEIKRVNLRVRELEESLKSQSERHHREARQFNELLNEKDKRIETIETQKRQIHQDLETVWKTTTTTMQNTLKGRQN